MNHYVQRTSLADGPGNLVHNFPYNLFHNLKGELKAGGTVPWEIQLSNTLPDNFLWEKDKTSILTVAPGLYEVNTSS